MAATGPKRYEDDEFEDDDQNQADDDLDELLGSNDAPGDEGDEEGDEGDGEDGVGDLDDLLGSAEAAPEKEQKGKRLGDVMQELMSIPITPGKCPILSAPIGKKAEKRKRDSLKEAIEKRQRTKIKKLLADKEHVQPQFDHIERRLLQVATKGVVALFNAVAKHQKEATMAGFDVLSTTSAKTMDTKVSSLSKDSFLDMIKRSQAKPKTQDEGEGATWQALDTGYLLGKTRTKNWNEEDDEEDEDGADGVEDEENDEEDDEDGEPEDEDQDQEDDDDDDDGFDEKAALEERESDDDEEGEEALVDDFMSGLTNEDEDEFDDDDDDDELDDEDDDE